MIVKVKTTNIGDVVRNYAKRKNVLVLLMVEDKSQTRIDDAVKKDNFRVELKLLKEELLLPVSKRTESLFNGKLVAEEPVAVKNWVLEERDDKW